MSFLITKGAIKLDVSDFLESGTKEFLKASLLLEIERNKKMFGGK